MGAAEAATMFAHFFTGSLPVEVVAQTVVAGGLWKWIWALGLPLLFVICASAGLRRRGEL